MTNKAKYDVLLARFKEIESAEIRANTANIPASFFTISVDYTKHKCGYFIEERRIERVLFGWMFGAMSNPTRKNIAEIEAFLANPTFIGKEIYAHWVAGNVSGGDPLADIGAPGKSLAWTSAELEPELARLIEAYAPREGHSPCAYCRRQRKPDELIYATIIGRNWKHQNFTSPPFAYCKDGDCHSYDQMAHGG